jgi:DNA-binding SARP family transcriptional activator
MLSEFQSSKEYPEGTAVSMGHVWGLVEGGKYDAAAELLQQAYMFSYQAHKSVSANLLQMARQMCSELSKFDAELAWHRQACEEVGKRKIEQVQRLQSALSLAHRLSELDTQQIPVTSYPPAFHLLEEESIENRLMMSQSLKASANGNTQSGIAVKQPTIPWLDQASNHANRLEVYCLGAFQVYRNDEPLTNWQGRKGTAIFKYLLMNRGRQIGKETLMRSFWPDADDEAQRNNLNVAIYNMRQALRNGDPNFSYVIYENDCYFFNPDLYVWVDFEEFLKAYKAGQRYEQSGDYPAAIREYVAAESLYQGPFLPDDCYDDWIERTRLSLQSAYQGLLNYLSKYYLEQGNYAACIAACTKLIAVDGCDEEAYRRLMCCYSRQGQVNLALREYDRCFRSLKFDLEIEPSPETQALYQSIKQGEPV